MYTIIICLMHEWDNVYCWENSRVPSAVDHPYSVCQSSACPNKWKRAMSGRFCLYQNTTLLQLCPLIVRTHRKGRAVLKWEMLFGTQVYCEYCELVAHFVRQRFECASDMANIEGEIQCGYSSSSRYSTDGGL